MIHFRYGVVMNTFIGLQTLVDWGTFNNNGSLMFSHVLNNASCIAASLNVHGLACLADAVTLFIIGGNSVPGKRWVTLVVKALNRSNLDRTALCCPFRYTACSLACAVAEALAQVHWLPQALWLILPWELLSC